MDPENNPSSIPSTTPRVSVVIPCYNCSDSLQTSVQSISNQSYESIEIIAVDDGSTDATLDILNDLARVDQRLRIITRGHEGIVGALNVGIEECRGQYIARMDADDIAHTTRIEKQTALLDQDPELVLAGSLVEVFPIEDVGEGFKLYLEWMNGLITHAQIVREIFIESPFAHPSVMIRKKWLDHVGGYGDVEWAEDYDLWMRLYLAGAKFGKVPEVLLSWRERSDRLTWTDDRYSKEKFRRAKSHYLIAGPLKGKEAVFIWGAGQTGKKVSNLLLDQGVPIVAFVDIDPAKVDGERRGFPIISPQSLPEVWRLHNNPALLAAVAARGARELIREHLLSISLVEGADWWAVA